MPVILPPDLTREALRAAPAPASTPNRTSLAAIRQACDDVRRTAPALSDQQCQELDQLVYRFLRAKLTVADRGVIATEPTVRDLLCIVTCVLSAGRAA
jgi:hypothetical protein